MIYNLLGKNVRRPTGWFGRLVVWVMNIEHSGLTDWGLRHLSVEKHHTALDVGCGGGRTVHKLAEIAAEGKVYGIDPSEESLAAARRMNQRLIRLGRAEMRPGSVATLPFHDCTFDLVTAVETHYFWPDLLAGMREILRVLRPGGKLMILAEIYRGGKFDRRNEMFAERMHFKYYSVAEITSLFAAAGYSDVELFEEYDRGWMCGIGKRPDQ